MHWKNSDLGVWNVETPLHVYNLLSLRILWCKYEVLGCLLVFFLSQILKKSLHSSQIESNALIYSVIYVWRVCATLHISSPLITPLSFSDLGYPLTGNSLLCREDLWRLVKRQSNSSHSKQLVTQLFILCLWRVKSFFWFSIFSTPII